MPDITMSQVTDLNDPKVRAVAKRVLNAFLMAAEKAVATQAEPSVYKMVADPKSVEQIFLSRFKTLEATQQEAARVCLSS